MKKLSQLSELIKEASSHYNDESIWALIASLFESGVLGRPESDSAIKKITDICLKQRLNRLNSYGKILKTIDANLSSHAIKEISYRQAILEQIAKQTKDYIQSRKDLHDFQVRNPNDTGKEWDRLFCVPADILDETSRLIKELEQL